MTQHISFSKLREIDAWKKHCKKQKSRLKKVQRRIERHKRKGNRSSSANYFKNCCAYLLNLCRRRYACKNETKFDMSSVCMIFGVAYPKLPKRPSGSFPNRYFLALKTTFDFPRLPWTQLSFRARLERHKVEAKTLSVSSSSRAGLILMGSLARAKLRSFHREFMACYTTSRIQSSLRAKRISTRFLLGI